MRRDFSFVILCFAWVLVWICKSLRALVTILVCDKGGRAIVTPSWLRIVFTVGFRGIFPTSICLVRLWWTVFLALNIVVLKFVYTTACAQNCSLNLLIQVAFAKLAIELAVLFSSLFDALSNYLAALNWSTMDKVKQRVVLDLLFATKLVAHNLRFTFYMRDDSDKYYFTYWVGSVCFLEFSGSHRDGLSGQIICMLVKLYIKVIR